ncbi:MAG: MFS transporter [Thermoproteota archaeon]|nr:MFS transporter [Thermoproteota archaeon]
MGRPRGFIIVWLLMFLITFAAAMVSPPIPYIIKEFFVEECADEAAIEEASAAAFGIIMAVGAAALMLGNLFGGFLADILGRRKIVFVSFTVLAFGCAVFSVAPSLFWLFLASFIEMFAVGLSSPAFKALVADYSTKRSRGAAYGTFNLSWITAQIPAPLIGGVLSQFLSLRMPFNVAIDIALLGLFFSLFVVEPRRAPKLETEQVDDAPTMKTTMPLKRVIAIFGLTNLLNGLLNGVIGPLMNVFLVFRLNANPSEFGMVSSLAFGVTTGLVQIPGGKLADKIGRKPLVLFSFLGAPLVMGLAMTQSIAQFTLVVAGICAIGNISSPAVSAWLMDFLPKSKRASASGIMGMLNGAGRTTGPVIGTAVWNYAMPNVVLPFGVVTLLWLASFPLYLKLAETKKKIG